MTIDEERRELEEERRTLEKDKEDFVRKMEIENKRLEQQMSLFDMKVKILEEELYKLAREKELLEKQKEFYYRVRDFQEENETSYEPDYEVVKGDKFFAGVESRISLRKRYRNLIKIYHPDNIDGDNNTIQEINREYEQLSKAFGL